MTYQDKNVVLSDVHDHALSCPDCESDRVVTEWIDHRFPYGRDDSAIELSARIPVRRCEECGDQFLDAEAEDLMHEAVCRHLGVMTPREVRDIRRQSGRLSRAEFSRITRLGEATIGRWERGELIQNAAYDQLLYLLTFPENLVRIRERIERSAPLTKNAALSCAPPAACPKSRT